MHAAENWLIFRRILRDSFSLRQLLLPSNQHRRHLNWPITLALTFCTTINMVKYHKFDGIYQWQSFDLFVIHQLVGHYLFWHNWSFMCLFKACAVLCIATKLSNGTFMLSKFPNCCSSWHIQIVTSIYSV